MIIQTELQILALGAAFGLTAKPIDLIDENKWITGQVGFILKYFFVLLFSYVIFLSLKADPNLTPHFLSLFLFWVLKGKFGYPSHVLLAFITALLLGPHLTTGFAVLSVAGLAVNGVLDHVVRHFKSKAVQILLYKSLARFLVVPLGLSLYLDDYNPFFYTIPGLLLMHLVRYLIRKDVIHIREGVRT